MIRTYRELSKLRTFKERYEYLKLQGEVGASTFGHDRYLNQVLYHSIMWKSVRDEIIIRDNGRDLAVGEEITDLIVIHHMNSVTPEEIERGADKLFDPDFLICTCHKTHMAIHYGDESLLPKPLVVRRQGDTIPWR